MAPDKVWDAANALIQSTGIRSVPDRDDEIAAIVVEIVGQLKQSNRAKVAATLWRAHGKPDTPTPTPDEAA